MQQLHGKAVVNQTIDLDTKAIRKSGVIADGSLTSWLYVHWDTLKDFIRRITGINNVIRVKAVFTSNITISASGTTVDGYTLLNNDIVLVAGQTDTTQNGLYTWATGGALTRVAPFTSTFAAGLAILNIALQGRIFHVLNGNINRNTFWYFDSPTQFPVIGTSSLLFYNVANLKVSTASNNLIVQGTDGIEVKLKNSGTVNGGEDAVFGGLQYNPATREFYIITSLMPGASGSLTIENSSGTVLGIASKQRFSNDFILTWDSANSRITVAINKDIGINVFEDFVVQNYSSQPIAIPEGNSVIMGGSGLAYRQKNGASFSLFPIFAEDLGYGVYGVAQRFLQNTTVTHHSDFLISNNIDFKLLSGKTFEFREKTRFLNIMTSAYSATHGIDFASGFLSIFDLNTTNQSVPQNGAYFYLVGNENSGRLQAVTTSGGVSTKVDTGITIATTQYYVLRVLWNGTSALFYVNGSLVATISTNITASVLLPSSRLKKRFATAQGADYLVNTDWIDYSYS